MPKCFVLRALHAALRAKVLKHRPYVNRIDVGTYVLDMTGHNTYGCVDNSKAVI